MRAPISLEQAIANCPDEHGQGIFRLFIDSWKKLGHEVKPGIVGVAFRADMVGTMQSIFCGSREGLQGAFSTLLIKGAPAEAVQKFRLAVSHLEAFETEKLLKDAQPITKFRSLTHTSVQSLIAASMRWCALGVGRSGDDWLHILRVITGRSLSYPPPPRHPSSPT